MNTTIGADPNWNDEMKGMNTNSYKSSCRLLPINDALTGVPTSDGKRFATIFEHGTLLVEIYAPRGADPQQPHTRDEVYFVASGSGEYVCGDTRTNFGPTDLLFAAAGVVHRFENFTDDLAVWVLFYGPEGGETPDK
jgi:mannose-6-phosphate isomerase-like protein (cupin superfamily)